MAKESTPAREYVAAGAPMLCDKGTLPSPLVVPPRSVVIGSANLAIATTRDKDPLLNNFNFGVCAVTQKPCIATCRPLEWQKVQRDFMVEGGRALLDSSFIPCAIGGSISFKASGQLA